MADKPVIFHLSALRDFSCLYLQIDELTSTDLVPFKPSASLDLAPVAMHIYTMVVRSLEQLFSHSERRVLISSMVRYAILD